MAEERILVTGASGFVGPHVVAALIRAGYRPRLALRSPQPVPAGAEAVVTGDLSMPVDWRAALEGIDHVVHMAGLAHAGPGLDEVLYRRINTEATLELARAAEKAGVQRFVYLSSIKALTDAFDGPPLREDMEPAPGDAYGRSKLAAEQGLAARDLDWVALRPVLIYGPGVKANMAALLKLARLPVTLPLGGLNAPRSLLAIENLAGAILFALTPACPGRQSYALSDPEPISVADMLAAMRSGLGRSPGLLPVPEGWLHRLARLAGREETFLKLAGSLVARPERLLSAGWRPQAETKTALAQLAAASRAG
ncbi:MULTISPECIES: NAD-dependent epimerase/dehydratase family protein [Bosea]|uniref:NAD-dependent epimerase/dehydratase family protein n=1 Tax=Bosea TaxID=85413 RepID=UPI00214F690F|nr:MULTISPECIES: NAD-dependent epimerase/dehydratase family protein [Bosea]MCR4521975.1 NAD-dependent epimerase/dehydratase family protein [Bosea sp. 47.2.35]MDR6829547.1 UDP-glucose 4-epimerase [Bosea robiniae]MDR6896430.1 UDP-glucose 4-epimerase [Bosea sp. BE109]MDR7139828.1 UDP-glucose 4-epimerase [Bosea sp. BE168]MDR7176450.1 UDP-glucose 4-epimerase [Bosea sp. BE271]